MYVKNSASELLAQTIDKVEGAYAPSTIRAYKSNFEKFIRYCNDNAEYAIPSGEEVIANYIQYLTKLRLKSASIRIAIASIATIHKLNGLNDPTQSSIVKIEMRRMHRLLSRASNQAYGITSELLKRLIHSTDNSLKGLRDRALVMVAYDTMCRRSELVSLRIEDIRYSEVNGENYCSIILKKSKTDQESLGKHLHISEETASAIKAWLSNINENTGPIFRGFKAYGQISDGLSEGQINRIYKSLARQAKFDQKIIQRISGHSMRVGAAQDLVCSGASLPILMFRGRWSKSDTVMRYVEQINQRLV